MLSTPFENKLRGMVEPSLAGLGYRLVLIRLKEGAKRRVLEIIAERADDTGMGIEDCEKISHTVSALLDVEDPISDAYQLEVSSPGLDRPLVSKEDFARFMGYEIKVETIMPVDGRKRFKGTLDGAKGDTIELKMDGATYPIDFENIRSAKLVLTDELMATYLKKQKKKVQNA